MISSAWEPNDGVLGLTLDIELVSAPPSVRYEVQQPKSKIECPSRQYPKCYFNTSSGELIISPSGFPKTSADILTSDDWVITTYGDKSHPNSGPVDWTVIVAQNATGSSSLGTAVLIAVVSPGHTGEYTFVFGRSGIYSRPVTFTVGSLLAAIEIIEEPEGLDTAVFGAGDLIPMPAVRLSKADGSRLAGYAVAAEFVMEHEESGNWTRAPVLIDVGEYSYNSVLGTQYSFRSAGDGSATWSMIWSARSAPRQAPCSADRRAASSLRWHLRSSPRARVQAAVAACVRGSTRETEQMRQRKGAQKCPIKNLLAFATRLPAWIRCSRHRSALAARP